MKAEADRLIAAIVAYANDPRAIRRMANITALRTALDVGGHVVVDVTADDPSDEAAALEAAAQAVEAALDTANAPYVVTRLLEVWPQSVGIPAGGWAHDEVPA